MSRTNYGKRNRKLGHDAERLYAKMFRDIGYPRCITSRKGSRIHDDSGIDLIHIPYNVQVKAGIQRGLNPMAVLRDMEEKIKMNFPSDSPVHTKPSMIILRKNPGRGKKRDKFHELVIMTFADFETIIKRNLNKIEHDTSGGPDID